MEGEDSEKILNERYARGEIGRKRYLEMKAILGEDKNEAAYETPAGKSGSASAAKPGEARDFSKPAAKGVSAAVQVLLVLIFGGIILMFALAGLAPSNTYLTTTAYYQTTASQYNATTTYSYYTTTIPQSSHGLYNGNFTFTFTLLNGRQDTWTFPVDTYNQYVAAPRISPALLFNVSGSTLAEPDYRGVVTPSFFSRVVPRLTENHTAGQFVDEVVNLKNQLTTYSLVFENTSVYPAEVLGLGKGDCKDFGVLMGSILEAGNQQAGYGMQVQFVYVNSSHLNELLRPDHLILYVTFANGTKWWVDTTNVLPHTDYIYIKGYFYTLNCTAESCQTQTLCQGNYCDAVFYYSSENHWDSCTSPGYVIGADNQCHQECSNYDTYCNSGSSCYDNECRSCQSGYYLGTDGRCYPNG